MISKKIEEIRRVAGKFQIISVFFINGSAWLFEVIIFWMLTKFSIRILWANFLANSFIIIISFFVVAKSIFRSTKRNLFYLSLIDLTYNFLSAFVFSFLIEIISTKIGIEAILTKAMVSPIKFYLGYMQISWLVKGKIQFY